MKHPTMTSIGSEHIISDGNIYRKYRNGRDEYVFWKKLEDVITPGSQHRSPPNYTPWSRQNWRQMKMKINTYFSEIENDFILLHKPYSTH